MRLDLVQTSFMSTCHTNADSVSILIMPFSYNLLDENWSELVGVTCVMCHCVGVYSMCSQLNLSVQSLIKLSKFFLFVASFTFTLTYLLTLLK